MKLLKIMFTLLCCFFFQLSDAQYIITGKVVGESGDPLQYISVVIQSQQIQKIGVMTDSEGKFTLNSKDPSPEVSFTSPQHEELIKKITQQDNLVIVLLKRKMTNEKHANIISLDDVRVNAFERNSDVRNAPVAITILNNTSLGRYNNTNFLQAINTVPGVKMDERSPGSYRLSIRGNLLRSTFGVRNVKMYWNGLPYTDANGTTYLNQIAFNNIGRMEVIKGPSGSMYGSGTGGVVLMSSPAIGENEKYFLLQSSVGSYGMFAANASYNVNNDNISSGLSYSHQESDGYRDHTNMRRDVANYTGMYHVNAKHDVSANVFYSDLYYQTPGGLNPTELAANPKQARPAAGAFKSAAQQQAALYLKTLYAGFSNDLHFNNNWSNTTGIYISNTNFKNPTIRNFERKTEQGVGMRSVLRYKHSIFSGTLGGEYQYSFNNISVFGNKLGIADTLQYHDEIDSRQFNIFLQTDVTIHKFLISGGISYNNYHYGFMRLSNAGKPKESNDFSPQFVPRLSISSKLHEKVNMYASVSKGYSPPSIDEVRAGNGIFNKELNAETGINYEAGIKSNPVKNKLWLDVSYYIFSLQNTIVNRRDSSGADFFKNAGKTKQSGLEVAVNYIPINNSMHFVRMLKAWGSYTNIHARFSEYQQGTVKYDGNKLTGTPPNVVVIGIDMNMAAGVFTNFTYNYTDAIPLNDANTVYGSHYNLLYLKAGVRTNSKRKISAEIYAAMEKSFNEPYSLGNDLNAAGNRFYNPSAPENFTGGVKLRLNIK